MMGEAEGIPILCQGASDSHLYGNRGRLTHRLFGARVTLDQVCAAGVISDPPRTPDWGDLPPKIPHTLSAALVDYREYCLIQC